MLRHQCGARNVWRGPRGEERVPVLVTDVSIASAKAPPTLCCMVSGKSLFLTQDRKYHISWTLTLLNLKLPKG